MKPERTLNRKMVEAALIMKQINGKMIQTVPDNVGWMDFHPFYKQEVELKDFSNLVSQTTDVNFHYMNCNELWEQWASINNKDIQMNVEALRQKYSININ